MIRLPLPACTLLIGLMMSHFAFPARTILVSPTQSAFAFQFVLSVEASL